MSLESQDAPGRLTEAQFQEWTEPRLMLFLSADLENSTRLKQNGPQGQPGEWLQKVFRFLSRFPTVFQARREMLAADCGYPAPARQSPWKILGDEVIFAIRIADAFQPAREVAAFAHSLGQWNDNSRNGTSVKGAVWMAGFPVANKIVPVMLSSGVEDPGRLVPDYIGPSMDAGFRIAKAATSRRLVLSVETAWWLLTLNGPGSGNSGAGTCPDHIRIHFQGCLEYKGLAVETGYPLIWTWIREPHFQKHEDALLGRCAAESQPVLLKLCSEFIREFGVPRHPPFLWGEEARTPDTDGKRAFLAALEDARELMRSLLLAEGTETAKPRRAAGSASQLLDQLREHLRGMPEGTPPPGPPESA